MTTGILKKVSSVSSDLSQRSILLLKQIKIAILFKAGSTFFALLSVRILLHHIGIDNYGVWAVLFAFMNWIIFFDFGIANGLKNMVSTATAKGEFNDAKEYIATAYISILLIVLAFYFGFTLVSHTLSWQSIFNIDSIGEIQLRRTIQIVTFFKLCNDFSESCF